MADHKITAAEFAKWIPAQEVYGVAQNRFGSLTASHILKHLAKGLLSGRAEHLYLRGDPKRQDYGPVPIPLTVWAAMADYDYPSRSSLWSTSAADVEVDGDRLGSTCTYEMLGVRFDPEEAEKMMPGALAAARPAPPKAIFHIAARKPPAAAPAPTPPPAVLPAPPRKNRAGRLPKDFWEDMLIAAMTAMFFEATLQPSSGADVQRWMEVWLTKNIAENDHPGETALKERAAKVFAAWRESRK